MVRLFILNTVLYQCVPGYPLKSSASAQRSNSLPQSQFLNSKFCLMPYDTIYTFKWKMPNVVRSNSTVAMRIFIILSSVHTDTD